MISGSLPVRLCSFRYFDLLDAREFGRAGTLVALYFVDRAFGLAGGFVVHANWLILIVLVPTMIGAGIGAASHRRLANGS